MADTILIYLADINAENAAWASIDPAEGTVSDSGREPLAQIAPIAQGKRLLLALSGSQLLLTRAEVPGSNAAKAAKAVPFALEERLAEDVDDLHFALGPRDKDGSFPVAIIARERFEQLIARLEEASLHPQAIIPAPLLLPLPEDAEQPLWVATSDGEQVQLRSGEYSGFGIDCALFDAVMPMALQEADEQAPEQVRLYADDAGRTALPPLRLELDEKAIDTPLAAYAGNVAKPPLDLLQGDYSRRQQAGKLWKPWKLTAALAVVWLAIVGSSGFIEYRDLGTESERLDAQMEELLKETFPDIKRVVNPQSQMRARLKKLRSGGGSGGDFVSTLSEVARALGATRGTTLQSVAWRSGRLELDLEADKLATLDALKQSLEKGGQLSATIQSANQEQGRVRGRVRLEAKS